MVTKNLKLHHFSIDSKLPSISPKTPKNSKSILFFFLIYNLFLKNSHLKPNILIFDFFSNRVTGRVAAPRRAATLGTTIHSRRRRTVRCWRIQGKCLASLPPPPPPPRTLPNYVICWPTRHAPNSSSSSSNNRPATGIASSRDCWIKTTRTTNSMQVPSPPRT